MTNDTSNIEDERKLLSEAVKSGGVTQEDADRIEKVIRAFDPDDMTLKPPANEDGHHRTKKPSTVAGETANNRRTATRMETALTDATAHDLNQHMTDLRKGNVEGVKDDGLSPNSISTYQCALKSFYRVNDDLGVDPDDITLIDIRGDSSVSPDDMLTKDEIAWCRDAAEYPRDKALFDFLLYTGQRNTAARSLKIKHLDLENGNFELNGDAEGLKGADEIGKTRPLLGSVSSIRTWLDYHPYSDDGEAYVFVSHPAYRTVDPYHMLSRNAIAKITRKIKNRVQEKHPQFDKPLNPHALRHNFVTLAVREYHLDDGTIKFLIGHAPDSDVMRTTYAHLRDEDYVERANVAAGLKEPTDGETLTPEFCHTCKSPLEPNAKACGNCGTLYAPDAKRVTDDVQESLYESKGEAQSEEEEQAVDATRDLLSDPDMKARLFNEMRDELLDELREELNDE